MQVDLHCHSYCSDGELSPKELLSKAESQQIKIFSITDHDNIDAYKHVSQITTDVRIISGIEFSTTWNKIGIHVVGLNFDLNADCLKKAVAFQKNARMVRAETIAQKLEKYGLFKAIQKINAEKNGRQIGRPDFAQLLVDEGIYKTQDQAFKKVLGAGKACDVKNNWLGLENIIDAIKNSGGMAVLAHPLHYKLTKSKLNRLLVDFKNYGGQGLEVLSGYQTPDKTQHLINVCTAHGLKASVGSDFHRCNQWSKLGCDSKIIGQIDTVWDCL